MTIASRVAVAAVASLLLAGTSFAQTAPAAKTDAKMESKKSDAMAPTDKMAKPHTAASIECSKEAEAVGLHGKERKKYRSECKKEAAAKAKQ